MSPALLLPLALACWDAPRQQSPREEAVVEEMAAHGVQAEALREAVVRGDLPGAQAAAADLALRLPVSGLPADADRAERALRDAVARVAASTDIQDAAEATGALVVACGDCHLARGVTFHQPVAPRPGDGPGVPAEMARHHWAATRMWQGLVLGEAPPFREAAELLAASSLTPGGTGAASPLPPLTVDLEVRVHDLVARAARTDDPAERGRAFGALLATCASCHDALHAGPRAPGTPPGSPLPD